VKNKTEGEERRARNKKKISALDSLAVWQRPSDCFKQTPAIFSPKTQLTYKLQSAAGWLLPTPCGVVKDSRVMLDK